MTDFFSVYPKILENCYSINQDINSSLQTFKIEEKSYNFDLILPFLINGLEEEKAKQLARELQIHREIVNQYNQGNKNTEELKKLLSHSIKVKTYEEYQSINFQKRLLIDDDIIKSYLLSTERVYYRFDFIKKLSFSANRKNELLSQIKLISAFLLFDDDITDLEGDIINGKTTILIHHLSKVPNIELTIKEFFYYLKDEITEKGFLNFIYQFFNAYNYIVNYER